MICSEGLHHRVTPGRVQASERLLTDTDDGDAGDTVDGDQGSGADLRNEPWCWHYAVVAHDRHCARKSETVMAASRCVVTRFYGHDERHNDRRSGCVFLVFVRAPDSGFRIPQAFHRPGERAPRDADMGAESNVNAGEEGKPLLVRAQP